jgi:hypothetical protein
LQGFSGEVRRNEIAAAGKDMKNPNGIRRAVLINNEITVGREASKAGSLVFTGASQGGIPGQQPEPGSDRVYSPIGSLNTLARAGDIQPDVVHFRLGLGRAISSFNSTRVLLGSQARHSPAFYVVRQLPEFGFSRNAAAFSASERLLREFDRDEYFDALSFTLLP